MFATIAGPYPHVDGSPADALDAILGDQLQAGLGMVGDGSVRYLESDEAVEVAVAAWQAAAARTAALAAATGVPAPPVKSCLVGPLSTPGVTDAAIERANRAVRALHAAGAPVVQVDEPWLATPDAGTDAGRERASLAWTRLLDRVTGHVTLGVPGGGASAVGVETLVAAPFASYLVDLIAGPDDWRPIAKLPGELGVILGITDLRTSRADTKEVLVWAARYAASMRGRGPERVGLAPSAGLDRLPREAARKRLEALAEAAGLATLPAEELARQLDPRSIDARSAALGRWEPRRGPRRGSPGG